MAKKSMQVWSILCCCFIFCGTGLAQKGCFEIDWAYNYGGSARDWGTAIDLTSDGGYIVGGYSKSSDIDVSSNSGDWDFWLVKLDENGQIQWEKNLGGSINDEATSILETADGSIVIAGSTYSNDGNVANNNGDEDYWIIKLSATGDFLWEKTYGGTDVDRAESIKQTTDGGYIVAGFSASQSGDVGDNYGNFDCWIIRLDASGDLLWEKNYGGSGADWAYGIDITNDGGYIFTGSTISENGDVSDNNGFYDYWVVRIDDSGAILWERNFGGDGEDRSYDVRSAANGDFFIAGSTYSNNMDVSSNNGGSDFWILRIDAMGDLIWERSLGGMNSEWAWNLDITTDDGIVVTGRSNTGNGTGDVTSNNGGTDFWMVKLDVNGTVEWQNNYGGASKEVSYGIRQTPDGGFVMVGYSESEDGDVVDNYGDWDYWVVKISPRELEVDLGNDTTLCIGATLLLDGNINDPEATYEWQDASTDSVFTVTEAGLYWVEVSVDDCLIRDSIEITYLGDMNVDLGPDTAFCAYEPFTLNASFPTALGYRWPDGTTDSLFQVTATGQYWAEVEIAGCFLYDTIRVSFNNPYVDLGKDTFMCEGDFIVLNANFEESTYLWQDGSTDPKYLALDTGTYQVTVDLNGCQAADTIHIRLCEKFRDPCLEIPNAFTPNGDAVNEIFQLHEYCRMDTYQLSIFNRWGERVFATNDVDAGWDGTFRGGRCQQGVYVYVIEYDYTVEGETFSETRKGNFVLMR